VALAGPILRGELPEGENYKDAEMDAYEAINKDLARKYRIDYMPLRQKFEAAEPDRAKSEKQSSGKLTQDGEHPNHRGEGIIEENFLKQILSWNGLWES